MTQTPDPTPTPGAPPPRGAAAHSMWDDILDAGVRRDPSRKWFAGVCAGVARRFDVDPVLIRAAVVALTLFGGIGALAYIAAWLFLPDEDGTILARTAVSGQGGSEATGAIALAVLGVIVFAAIIFGDNGFLVGWVVLPLAVIGWLVWRQTQPKTVAGPAPEAGRSEATATDIYAVSAPAPAVAPQPGPAGPEAPAWQPPSPPSSPPQARMPLAPPPPPRPRRRTAGFAGLALTLGVAAVGYGVGFLLDDAVGFSGSAELLGLIVALTAASLVTLLIGLSGRRSLLSAVLVILLGLGTAGASVGDRLWEEGQRGSRTFTPAISTQPQRFEHGGGDVTLDLRPLATSLAAPGANSAGPQRISVDQTVGELTVIIPSTASARVDAEVAVGNIEIQDSLPGAGLANDQSDRNGPGLQRTVTVGAGAPTIVVDAELRFGEITIKEG